MTAANTAHSAPPDPLTGFEGGPTSKGREGNGREGKGRGRGRKGRKGEGREWRKGGRGRKGRGESCVTAFGDGCP